MTPHPPRCVRLGTHPATCPDGRKPVSWTAVEVIRRKRDGEQLPGDAVRWVVDGFTRGAVAPEQMSALLMAVFHHGLSPAELAAWTDAMVASGRRLDLSAVGRPVVDKHSSGGVGDKVSLVVAPLVASFGVAVPKLSGRGLGHTGGTLDKLESIPGWTGALSGERFLAQLRDVGAVIAAAGDDLAPADKALMPTVEAARELAETMVSLGAAHGVRTVALLTSMDAPLGRAVGNALEVAEAIEVLEGGGRADLVEVCLAVATQMLALGGRADVDPAAALHDGSALALWRRMVQAQDGDPDAPLPRARHVEVVTAERAGFLGRLDARAVGTAAWRLGAGRARKEDAVSASAGVRCLVRPGDAVQPGTPLLELHAEDPARLADGLAALAGCCDVVDDEPGPTRPLVLEQVGDSSA